MALPVNDSTHLIPAYYSFYRPRKDERLSWPSWLTCSKWLTHISGHPSAAGRAQDRESSPARDRRSTTVPRHQPLYCIHFTLFVTYLLPILPADCCICIVSTPFYLLIVTPTNTHHYCIILYNSCIYFAQMITYLLYPFTVNLACHYIPYNPVLHR